MKLSNFLQGKMEEKVNVNLDSSILDKAQPYSFSFKKMHVMLYRELPYHFLSKIFMKKRNELVIMRCHENKFYLSNYNNTTIIAYLKQFSQNDYKLYFQ